MIIIILGYKMFLKWSVQKLYKTVWNSFSVITQKVGNRFLQKLFNPLSANLTKCLNTLKQIVSRFLTNCLSAFDHFVGLVPKGLNSTFNPFLLKFSFSWMLFVFLQLTKKPVTWFNQLVLVWFARINMQKHITLMLS